jgi:hypothetical protein
MGSVIGVLQRVLLSDAKLLLILEQPYISQTGATTGTGRMVMCAAAAYNEGGTRAR